MSNILQALRKLCKRGDLVIVRRGLDYGRQGFDRWDLTREVLKAFDRVSDER